MINVEFFMADGTSTTVYDVHPASQQQPVKIPVDAVSLTIWLGTRVQTREDTPA